MVPRAAVWALVLNAAEAPPASAAEAGADALKYFTPEEIDRGAARARQSRLLWVASLVWGAATLVALTHPELGGRLFALAARLLGAGGSPGAWRSLAATALGIALMIAVYLLLRKPFVWARGYWLEHRWGLSNQSAGSFLSDWAKGFLITVVMYTVALAAVVLLRATTPTWWPVAAWGAVSVLVVFMVFVWPVVIDPLFHRFTPVSESRVRERAHAIAGRAGIEAGEILWIDASRRTRRTNAYFTGLGATKRIVLYDTLRGADGTITPDALDELETILAHEAGHWREGHMWKGTALAVAGMGVFFLLLWAVARSGWSWVAPSSLPEGARIAPLVLLLALAVQSLTMPAGNAVSRSWERQADRASLELSGKPEAFIRAEVELARRNLSEIRPSSLAVFWLYTHPPVLERIAMGEESLRLRDGNTGTPGDGRPSE